MSILQAIPAPVKAGEGFRELLLALGYSTQAANEAWAHYLAHGTAKGSGAVDPGDVERVDAVAARELSDALAEEFIAGQYRDGWVERPASEWPAWVDSYYWEPFEPTPADREWAAGTSPTRDEHYRVVGRAPAPAGAPAPFTRPLTPVSQRLAGNWSDADQARHGCV